MQPLSVTSFLAAVVMASPSPQPTLKTIITVHSSEFCTALAKTVRPALAGLVQNDQLIERGRSVFAAAGDRAKHGGVANASGNIGTGPPTWSPTAGDTMMVESRQRQLAKTIADNVGAIETILSDKKRLAAVTANDEDAKLLSIESQLSAIAAKQRTAVNIISGQAEGSELAGLYNHAPSWGGADATNGASPLVAMEAGHGNDGNAQYTVWAANQAASRPFYDPWEIFAVALVNDQQSIAQAEDVASKAIVEAAGGCK